MSPGGPYRITGPFVLALLLCLPAVAAHAEIASVEPPSGARLDQPPTRVRLELTQPIEPSNVVLTVTDQDGRRVDLRDVQVTGGDRPVVTVSLQPGLPPGAYLISLTATSLTDSHRVTYTRSFAVGAFDPFETTGIDERANVPAAAARSLLYLGLALVLGGLLMGMRLHWPDRIVAPVRLGAALHAVAMAWLLLTSRHEAQQTWSAYLDTTVGAVMAVRAALALLVLLLALAAAPRDARRGAALAGAVVLSAVATARFTHASVRGPGAIASDALHILAAGVWVGGLLLLLWLWLDPRRDPVADAKAFSTPALLAVIGIAVTGVLASILILGPVRASPATLLAAPYGTYLAGKVGLALAMVAIAAVNRYGLLAAPDEPLAWMRNSMPDARPDWLRPAYDPRASPRRGLRRLVGTEAACGVAVLVLAGMLLSTSPPAAAETTDVLRLTGQGNDFDVAAELAPAPAPGGSSSLGLLIQYAAQHPDAPGQPLTEPTCGGSACVQVHITGADGTVDETFVAVPEGDGWWRVESIVWPQAGSYALTIRISSEFVYLDEVSLQVQA